MKITDSEFNDICRNILEISLRVEKYLDYFIYGYFGYCGTQEKKYFGQVTLQPTERGAFNMHKISFHLIPFLDFEDKIKLFSRVCISEGIDEKLRVEVKKNLKRIQEKRNQVAHSERYFTGESKLMTKAKEKKIPGVLPFIVYNEEEMLELNMNLVKELLDCQIVVQLRITQILNNILKKEMKIILN